MPRYTSMRLGAFATHALRARPNLRAAEELLGHAWVATTQRYTHLEVEDLQQPVADLPANRPRDLGDVLPWQ
jgi:site-specific recombinase XerC